MTKYKVEDIIEAKVTGIENYGIFVSVDDKYNGLVHISEISDSFVRNVHDYVQIDETIFVKVIDIDEENCQLKLSIKDINYKSSDGSLKNLDNGFAPLKKHLEKWTEEKIKEYEK